MLPILIASLAQDTPGQHTTLGGLDQGATAGPKQPKCFCVVSVRLDRLYLPWLTAGLYLDTGVFNAPLGSGLRYGGVDLRQLYVPKQRLTLRNRQVD
jgi:hypothetical protein